MKKIFFISVLLIFLIIPSVIACSSPVVYNEYGVPISLYGNGILTINGSKYDSSISLLQYNLTVSNTNNQSFTINFNSSPDLLNYVFGNTATLDPNEKRKVPIYVYIDGDDKVGEIRVTGQCADGMSMPYSSTYYSFFKLVIDGRNIKPPNVTGCENIYQMNGCYDGYYRNYYCSNNTPQYSESCTSYCCQKKAGKDGYCQNNVCIDPITCEDECSFTGRECRDGDAYSCVLEEDGCYHLVLKEECGDDVCIDGQCVSSSIHGKIAFLCQSDDCNDGIESQLISWLNSKGWIVDTKAYDSWDDEELDDYDVMMCSDQLKACKISPKSPVYIEHKLQNKPFIEISDYREAQSAYAFNYVKTPYGYLEKGKSIFITKTEDPITEVFSTKTKIFSDDKKITVMPDYRLTSLSVDLADVEEDKGRSTLFKVDSLTRYAYVGWFYKASVFDLTEDGKKLLLRTVLWAACGDECFDPSSRNRPPVAKAMIIPIAYEGMIVLFDASQSYDPENQTLTYYWDFGDGSNSGWISESITTHVYDSQGIFNITLIVSDGELDSIPDIKTLTILPKIKNRIAFVCGKEGCIKDTEQELMKFLQDNGYFVEGRTQDSWTDEDLNNFDFMVCSDAVKGCGIKSWTAVFDRHANKMMGFLEISDYQYIRAGYKFGYTSTYSGYYSKDRSIKIVGNDPITSDLSGKVYNRDDIMGGIFTSSLEPVAINLVNMNKKDVSVLFKVDTNEKHGRYAYVGWFYRSSIKDLTDDGKKMLLRTIRWVQCGNVEGCIQ
ncbi:MAG: PKD domain-containing protein [Candidatus Aenigmarchaeota archaeon]|nr:PKD domain-containing protein [Candidatus Aenigmarchaeota archaeon]